MQSTNIHLSLISAFCKKVIPYFEGEKTALIKLTWLEPLSISRGSRKREGDNHSMIGRGRQLIIWSISPQNRMKMHTGSGVGGTQKPAIVFDTGWVRLIRTRLIRTST